MSIPFSVYDFSGYLVAGFLAICSVEQSSGNSWLVHQNLKVTTATWIGAADIIGHILANISSYFIEH